MDIRKSIIYVSHVLACAALAAPVPRPFEANVAHPGTWQTSCYRGETLAIAAQLVDGRGRPFAVLADAEARLLWSTNNADWFPPRPATVTTGGLIRATWTPDMDCGADAYRIFLGVSEGGTNINYGANLLLRMLGSPGAVPNELPLPMRVLDFSQIVITNAPWTTYTAGDNITITNGVISATGGGGTLTEETDPVFGAWSRTNALPHMSANDVRAIIETDAGPTNRIVRMDEFNNVMLPGFLNMGDDIILSRGSPGAVISSDDQSGNANLGGTMWLYSPEFSFDAPGREIAVKDDLSPYATRSWTLSTYGGTNYWMAIDGKLLGVYSCTNAASGTNTLWESSAAMGGQLSDVALRATNNTVRITALEARPDLTSWGDYAPDGTPNPDAEAVLYLNKALTLMGSGFSWATAGAYACLCQSGAVAFHAETNGEVRIGLDVVSNYFGMVQGGSVTVGCMTHGIRVEGSGDNTIVHLLYAYAGGEFPVIWGMTSLAGDKTELSPVWTDYGDGTAEAAVPGHPFYFFTATSSRSMEARFESKAPAAFPGGIYGGFASPPVKYDTVITIQQGGHTYRIPAELVQ
ncbi:MAG: hypothetical protein IJQ73_07575 [Kiritimatiellae bacterium]|nr:hypothetical protein [Kiritimatiellia bacterium]